MTTRSWWRCGVMAVCVSGAALVAAAALGRSTAADEPKAAGGAAEAEQPLVYELRTYTALPGRLPALHQRFREHTLRLFEKHGMQNLYYLTPVDQDETLVYLLAHKSREAARASWEAFRNDPEWQRARAASEQDGRIVMKVESVFLEATDYSPKR